MVYHSNIAVLCIYFCVLTMSRGRLYMVQCNVFFFGILGNEYNTEYLWYVHQTGLFFRK
jgi:hypothetical protein